MDKNHPSLFYRTNTFGIVTLWKELGWDMIRNTRSLLKKMFLVWLFE